AIVILSSFAVHVGATDIFRSWKNRKSLLRVEVVCPLACSVGRQVDSRERPEFVCQVSLVIESTLDRYFSPRNFETGLYPPDCALKALQARPYLWWESNLLAKDLRKSAFAPTSAPRDVADRELVRIR